MLSGLFRGSRPPGGGDGGTADDEAEVEALLQRVSESRHATERREALGQLRDLLADSPAAQAAVGVMGLPVLLSVIQEDRDDTELLRTALEAMATSLGAGEGTRGSGPGDGGEAPPPPSVMNAELFARAPDNIRLVLSLLEDEPVGSEDFYCRYHALQALGALLSTAPERVQAAVLSAPLGVVRVMDLLACGNEVLRNEALLLLVGLCSGCEEVAKIAAFEGAFERLLALVAEEGGPCGGGVLVQDAAELANNLLRGSPANARLFLEMGHAATLPRLLAYSAPPDAGTAAAGLVGAAASAAAAAASGAPAGLAASAASVAAAAASGAAAAAATAAGPPAMPPQVAANFLALLETARLLMALPSAGATAAVAPQPAARTAAQDALAMAGLQPALLALACDNGGVPSAAVRAQAMLALGDLVADNPRRQADLGCAAVCVRVAPLDPVASPAPSSHFGGLWGSPQKRQQVQQLPVLQAALRAGLTTRWQHEAAAAAHLVGAFCRGNAEGQVSIAATFTPPPQAGTTPAAGPVSFGQELWSALAAAAPQPPGTAVSPLAGVQRSAVLVAHIVAGCAPAKERLAAALGGGDPVVATCMPHLAAAAQRGDPAGRAACCALLRLLVTWCHEAPAAVVRLLSPAGAAALLLDLAAGRLGGGDAASLPGLAALLLGTALLFVPDGGWARHHPAAAAAAAAAGPPGAVTARAVLDAIMQRLGLSQLFARLDTLTASKAFAAAKAGGRMPGHMSRAAAAAVLEQETTDAAVASAPLRHATDSAAAEEGLYDTAFAGLATELIAAVRVATVSAVAGSHGGGGGPAASAVAPPLPPPSPPTGVSLPGGSGLHGPPVPGPAATPALRQLPVQHTAPTAHAASPSPLLPPATAFPTGHTTAEQPRPFVPTLPAAAQGHIAATTSGFGAVHLQQQSQSSPPLPPPQQQQQQQQELLKQQQQQHSHQHPAALAVTPIQGHTETAASVAMPLVPAPMQQQQQQQLHQMVVQQQQQLAAALAAASRLQGEVDDLRSRNHALAQDLVRAGGGGGEGGRGGGGDAEANAALQLRVSRAEMEAGGLRQQLAAMQQRWAALESTVAEAGRARDEAAAATARAEADLASLSAAYNGLEEHAARLEAQLEEARAKAASAAAAAAAVAAAPAVAVTANGSSEDHGGGGLSPQEVEERVAAAVAEALKQQQQQQAATRDKADGAETGEGLAAAIEAARVEAAAEAEDAMGDLLVCLGREEARVEVLSARLRELGEDVDALLEGVGDDGDEGASEEDEAARLDLGLA